MDPLVADTASEQHGADRASRHFIHANIFMQHLHQLLVHNLPNDRSLIDDFITGSAIPPLSSSFQERLLGELNSTLLSISRFYWGESDLSEETSTAQASRLLTDMVAQKAALASRQAELQGQYERIQELVRETNEIHPRLQAELVRTLTECPPVLNSSRSASNDLLAVTIETSLLKLSLIRARAHITLYGYALPTIPEVNMAQSLSVAFKKGKEDERRLIEEERSLDHELDEYSRLLQLIDGPGGGFIQVVEDWTRVQKETEECRRDLRRLGWTGD